MFKLIIKDFYKSDIEMCLNLFVIEIVFNKDLWIYIKYKLDWFCVNLLLVL